MIDIVNHKHSDIVLKKLNTQAFQHYCALSGRKRMNKKEALGTLSSKNWPDRSYILKLMEIAIFTLPIIHVAISDTHENVT